MKFINALKAGLAGSITLTVTHQLLHRIFDDAPRMDLMGEEGLEKVADQTGLHIPEDKIYNITMAGDIVINGVYYALAAAGKPKKAIARGGLLGLAAGIGAIALPKHLGLTNAYSDRTLKTTLMTIAIYALGGLVSGALVKKLHEG